MQYEKAEQLGVAVWDYDSNGKWVKFQEAIVQQRVLEAERFRRESRLWIMAVVLAGASVLSAAAAIIAVCIGSGGN